MVSNLKKICRCCLSTDTTSLYNMSDTMFHEIGSEQKMKIIEIFFCCSGVLKENCKSSPDLFICDTCFQKLRDSYEFRELCQKSHETLENLDVKEEDEAADEDSQIICEDRDVAGQYLVSEVLIKEIKSEASSGDENAFVPSPEAIKNETSDENISIAKRIAANKSKSRKTKNPRTRKRRRPPKRVILPGTNRWVRVQSPDYEILYQDEDTTSIDFFKSKFQCLTCDQKYQCYRALASHRTRRKSYCKGIVAVRDKCLFCNETKIKMYDEHLRKLHPDYKPQQCLECLETFLTHTELKNHLEYHQTGNQFKCLGAGCGKCFSSLKCLKRHIAGYEHNPSTLKGSQQLVYNCPICGLTHEELLPLTEHIRAAHPNELAHKYYPCFYCKQIFLADEDHQKHLRIPCNFRKKRKSNKTEVAVACVKCNDEFDNAEMLLCHDIVTHLEIKERFFCDFCDSSFFLNASDLSKHEKEAHPDLISEMKFVCDQCGKGFDMQHKLTNHGMIHSSHRPFQCDYSQCLAKFKTKAHLKKHRELLHLNLENKFECNECGIKCKSLSHLKFHLIRLHFLHMASHQCNICLRRFVKQTELLRHLVTHTGDRSYACTLCQNTYTTETGLICHVRNKHTDIRYECLFCDKKLAVKKSMWKHIFSHRGFFPFNCPVCNYGCYPKELMKSHLKKHSIEYDDAIHGYHKETVDEVIAAGTKVSEPENIAFSANPNNLTCNRDILKRRMAEMVEQGMEANQATLKKSKTKNAKAYGYNVAAQSTSTYEAEYNTEY